MEGQWRIANTNCFQKNGASRKKKPVHGLVERRNRKSSVSGVALTWALLEAVASICSLPTISTRYHPIQLLLRLSASLVVVAGFLIQ